MQNPGTPLGWKQTKKKYILVKSENLLDDHPFRVFELSKLTLVSNFADFETVSYTYRKRTYYGHVVGDFDKYSKAREEMGKKNVKHELPKDPEDSNAPLVVIEWDAHLKVGQFFGIRDTRAKNVKVEADKVCVSFKNKEDQTGFIKSRHWLMSRAQEFSAKFNEIKCAETYRNLDDGNLVHEIIPHALTITSQELTQLMKTHKPTYLMMELIRVHSNFKSLTDEEFANVKNIRYGGIPGPGILDQLTKDRICEFIVNLHQSHGYAQTTVKKLKKSISSRLAERKRALVNTQTNSQISEELGNNELELKKRTKEQELEELVEKKAKVEKVNPSDITVLPQLTPHRISDGESMKVKTEVTSEEGPNNHLNSLIVHDFRSSITVEFRNFKMIIPSHEYYNFKPLNLFCETCLGHFEDKINFEGHTCLKAPPDSSKQIYKKYPVCFYEIDGNVEGAYCQNLCLLAMCFIQHKQVHKAVEDFLFYLCFITDDFGHSHISGYFSKQKTSKNNVSCLLVLPPYRKKGIGQLLIDLSYKLSQMEGVCGSPERPLSVPGKNAYTRYWKAEIVKKMMSINDQKLYVDDLAKQLSMTKGDVRCILKELKMWSRVNGKECANKMGSIKYNMRGKDEDLRIDKNYFHWIPLQGFREADELGQTNSKSSEPEFGTVLAQPKISNETETEEDLDILYVGVDLRYDSDLNQL